MQNRKRRSRRQSFARPTFSSRRPKVFQHSPKSRRQATVHNPGPSAAPEAAEEALVVKVWGSDCPDLHRTAAKRCEHRKTLPKALPTPENSVQNTMQPTLAAPDKNITPIARIAPNHIGALSSSLPAPVRKGALQYSFFSTSCDFKSTPTTLPPPGCMLCAERPQSIHNRAQPPPARAADARELLDDRGDQLLRDVLQDVRGPAAAAKQPRRPQGGSEHFAGSVFDTF